MISSRLGNNGIRLRLRIDIQKAKVFVQSGIFDFKMLDITV
jgi:hypothetical protein